MKSDIEGLSYLHDSYRRYFTHLPIEKGISLSGSVSFNIHIPTYPLTFRKIACFQSKGENTNKKGKSYFTIVTLSSSLTENAAKVFGYIKTLRIRLRHCGESNYSPGGGLKIKLNNYQSRFMLKRISL